MTIFIFFAGLLILCAPSCPFSFSFSSFLHTTSSHMQHAGISRLLMYYASSQIFISLAGVYENISLMIYVNSLWKCSFKFALEMWNNQCWQHLFLPVKYFSLSRLYKQFKNNVLWQWCCNPIGPPLLSNLSYICSNQGVRNLTDTSGNIWLDHLITNWFCD